MPLDKMQWTTRRNTNMRHAVSKNKLLISVMIITKNYRNIKLSKTNPNPNPNLIGFIQFMIITEFGVRGLGVTVTVRFRVWFRLVFVKFSVVIGNYHNPLIRLAVTTGLPKP